MTTQLAIKAPSHWDDTTNCAVANEFTGQIIYLVRREGLSSVFASQVARRMAAIAEAGFSVDVGVFSPLGQWVRPQLRRRWREMVESLPSSLAGRVVRLPSFPSRIDRPMTETRVLRWWLGSRYRGHAGPLIVQCRNATVTRMALRAKRGLPNARVIFDCRGVLDHEFLYERGMTYANASEEVRRQARQLSDEQREAAQEADAVFCVSEAMADYLTGEYGIARAKCLVEPCCVDVERFTAASGQRDAMRERLGFRNHLVVCYCGSLAPYQLPHASLNLFRQIRQIEPSAHFFAVTTAPAAMESAAREAGLPAEEVTIVSVSPDEVPAYLSAADVGLLLRERSMVNQVASPVKFGEYLASGLPVIMDDGIGDYSQLAQRERVGLVVPTGFEGGTLNRLLRDFVEGYCSAPATWRKQCQILALQCLDYRCYVPQITNMYQHVSCVG